MNSRSDAAHREILTLLGYDNGIRACAILTPGIEVEARSADLAWERAVAAALGALARDGEAPVVEVAIATAGGELIAVRDEDGEGRTAVAIVDRHALGSLVSSDLRAALRRLREQEAEG